ncbi:MAG: haloalkane dehalogenase, partial [Patescibacteria group bacterium]
FESKFITIDGYKIHYVEKGEGEPILFIHGNPTSSYLWRNILPTVANVTGKRGIALDLLGFGKSDKPDIEYTLKLHNHIVEKFIEELGLDSLTLVLHDWGGPLGMHYAVHHPKKIKAIALMETFMWDMRWQAFPVMLRVMLWLLRSPAGFFMIQVMNIFINQFIPAGVVNKDKLTDEVMRNYREPFPTIKSRRAIRVFPKLLPINGKPRAGAEVMKEIETGLSSFTCPMLWILNEQGSLTEKDIPWLREKIPQITTKNFGQGKHFMQEDNPEKLSQILSDWILNKK